MRHVTKEFLSESPDEYGSIICTISTSLVKDITHYTVEKGGSIRASVRIADCSNSVELDFYAEGQKSFDKRMAKLDKLIGQLQSMRGQYVEMWNSHLRDIEFYKKREGIKNE